MWFCLCHSVSSARECRSKGDVRYRHVYVCGPGDEIPPRVETTELPYHMLNNTHLRVNCAHANLSESACCPHSECPTLPSIM